MNENDRDRRTGLSRATTPEEAGQFWDSHSLADHTQETAEVRFEVRAQRRHRLTLEPDLYTQLEGAARSRGLSPDALVKRWVTEKLQSLTENPKSQATGLFRAGSATSGDGPVRGKRSRFTLMMGSGFRMQQLTAAWTRQTPKRSAATGRTASSWSGTGT